MRLIATATVNGQEVGRQVLNDRDGQQVASTLVGQAISLYRKIDGTLEDFEKLTIELVPAPEAPAAKAGK